MAAELKSERDVVLACARALASRGMTEWELTRALPASVGHARVRAALRYLGSLGYAFASHRVRRSETREHAVLEWGLTKAGQGWAQATPPGLPHDAVG